MAELNILGPIGDSFFEEGITAASVKKDLDHIDPDAPLDVIISSGGGSVFEGLSIYDMLVRRPGESHFVISGVAASIASIIPLAGDSVTMAQSARVMVHNPMGPSALAFGNSDDLREAADDTIKTADLLDSVKQTLIDIYAARTDLSRADLSAAMDAETWYTSKEALTAGFADKVTPNKSLAASAKTHTRTPMADVDELIATAELCERLGVRIRRQPSASKLRLALATTRMREFGG